jgi:hypothetical protein
MEKREKELRPMVLWSKLRVVVVALARDDGEDLTLLRTVTVEHSFNEQTRTA